MGKINNIAHGLASSFLSRITSITSEIKKPLENTGSFEVNLLKESISPRKLKPQFKEYIKHYKSWFISQIEKTSIKLSDIEYVHLKIDYKPGKNFGKYYSCKVLIKYNSKVYKAKESCGIF